MKILILTQYFPPETGAPQNRLFELAIILQNKGADITVLTAMPNYPQRKIHTHYKKKLYCYEELQGLKIHRSWIFVKDSKSIFFRIINYFSFVFSSFFVGLFKLKKYDYIFCESPPLFLGISAYLLKKIKKTKLIFNVSDLWPESAEKLGLISNKFLLKISVLLEEFLYKKSEIITCQTQGIVKNILNRFPDKTIYWLKNGVDTNFYNPENIKTIWREENGFSNNDFILLYAGIIGYAQGLDVILKSAQALKNYDSHRQIKFVLLGDGPEKQRLIEIKNKLNLDNVYFFNSVSKNNMPAVIKAIDVAVIPLKRLDIFKGAIPSKIFENLAMKKPILLGVEGEAKELFIDQGKCGLSFVPEDHKDLYKKIIEIYNSPELLNFLGNNALEYVKKYFSRDKIADEFWELIREQQKTE